MLCGGTATAAMAQGAVVHGSVSAATSEGTTGASFAGGLTYRFNRVVGLGVELAHVRSLPASPVIYCCGGENEGRATIFTTNLRLEIPTVSARVIPFVVAGGGVAGVTRSFDVWYAALVDQLAARQLPALGLTVLPGPQSIESTTTSMALTLGGGASLLVTDHLTVDADLRMLHLAETDGGRNIGRFGAGVSYRF
jgi:opacity protein-like surface antigen